MSVNATTKSMNGLHGRHAENLNLLRTQEAAMNISGNLPKIIVVAAIAGGIILFGSRFFSQS